MIRKADEGDLEQIIEVLSRYYFKVIEPVDNAVLDNESGDLISIYNEISELDLENGFVAELDGKIVGFSHYKAYKDDCVKTTLLSVLPESRNHGFGKQLQIARMKESFDKGYRTMLSFCDNQNAIDWYIKHFDYKKTGEDTNHHRLHFIRTADRVIWGIHYGFPDSSRVTVLECDLTVFFKDR